MVLSVPWTGGSNLQVLWQLLSWTISCPILSFSGAGPTLKVLVDLVLTINWVFTIGAMTRNALSMQAFHWNIRNKEKSMLTCWSFEIDAMHYCSISIALSPFLGVSGETTNKNVSRSYLYCNELSHTCIRQPFCRELDNLFFWRPFLKCYVAMLKWSLITCACD